MSYVQISDLSYQYKIFNKKVGLKNNLRDFFSRKYTLKSVLKGISFQIAKGEKVGLLGPNGAGKSTLIKLMTGIIQTQNGMIKVAGTIPDTNNNSFLQKIGVVMGQKGQLNWNLPALDTFRVIKSIYKIADDVYDQRLNQYLKMFNLQSVASTPVRKLSLGERTKLEIIASLLHGPEILILDEPTLGMDIVSQYALYDFINQLNESNGTTVLIISHQMQDIKAITDRIMVLLDGQIKFNGSIDNLKSLQKQIDPQIVVRAKGVNPITSYEDAQVKTDVDGNYVVTNYSNGGSITLNLDQIDNVNIKQPSLEDSIYQMFRGGESEVSN